MRALIITIVVLAAVLVGADRVAAIIAEGKIADAVQSRLGLSDKPDVSVHGFPLLTQAFAGTYDEIEVSAQGVSVQGLTGLDVTVHLRGVDLPLSKALSADLSSATAKTATASVRLPEAAFSDLVGFPVAITGAAGDVVTMTTSADIFGKQIPLTVSAHATIEGGTARLQVQGVKAAGVEVPSFVVSNLSNALSISLPLPKLAAGLAITRIGATKGALLIDAQGDNVPLSQGL